MSRIERPLPGFYFKVDFMFPSTSKLYGLVEAGFMEVSGLKHTLEFQSAANSNEPEEYKELGLVGNAHLFPIATKYDNVILKRGLTSDKKLVKWFQDSVTTLRVRPIPVLITLLNTEDTPKKIRGRPLMTWLLKDAYPVSWEFSGLKSMSNEFMLETIELRYSSFEFENK